MNTSSPDPFESEPMTAEERDMAMRLARIGPHGEPSPALDARIIGAAHAATGSPRPARRWPALIGLAATLALAVGVTWQLQPGGEAGLNGTVPETASAPASESPTEESPSELVTAPADMTRQLTTPEPPPPAPRAERDALAEQPAPRASVTPPPARSAAPAPPAPPAPAAPPLPAAGEFAEPVMRAAEADALRAESESLSRRTADDDARSRELRARIDRPAATAASPQSFPADTADLAKSVDTSGIPVIQDRELDPSDWIERIRLRRDSGDLAGARESLLWLRREHPQTPVPPDLLSLADE